MATIVKRQFLVWANAIIISLRFTTAHVLEELSTPPTLTARIKRNSRIFLHLMQCCGTGTLGLGTVTFALAEPEP
jgi:hypothetical protein